MERNLEGSPLRLHAAKLHSNLQFPLLQPCTPGENAFAKELARKDAQVDAQRMEGNAFYQQASKAGRQRSRTQSPTKPINASPSRRNRQSDPERIAQPQELRGRPPVDAGDKFPSTPMTTLTEFMEPVTPPPSRRRPTPLKLAPAERGATPVGERGADAAKESGRKSPRKKIGLFGGNINITLPNFGKSRSSPQPSPGLAPANEPSMPPKAQQFFGTAQSLNRRQPAKVKRSDTTTSLPSKLQAQSQDERPSLPDTPEVDDSPISPINWGQDQPEDRGCELGEGAQHRVAPEMAGSRSPKKASSTKKGTGSVDGCSEQIQSAPANPPSRKTVTKSADMSSQKGPLGPAGHGEQNGPAGVSGDMEKTLRVYDDANPPTPPLKDTPPGSKIHDNQPGALSTTVPDSHCSRHGQRPQMIQIKHVKCGQLTPNKYVHRAATKDCLTGLRAGSEGTSKQTDLPETPPVTSTSDKYPAHTPQRQQEVSRPGRWSEGQKDKYKDTRGLLPGELLPPAFYSPSVYSQPFDMPNFKPSGNADGKLYVLPRTAFPSPTKHNPSTDSSEKHDPVLSRPRTTLDSFLDLTPGTQTGRFLQYYLASTPRGGSLAAEDHHAPPRDARAMVSMRREDIATAVGGEPGEAMAANCGQPVQAGLVTDSPSKHVLTATNGVRKEEQPKPTIQPQVSKPIHPPPASLGPSVATPFLSSFGNSTTSSPFHPRYPSAVPSPLAGQPPIFPWQGQDNLILHDGSNIITHFDVTNRHIMDSTNHLHDSFVSCTASKTEEIVMAMKESHGETLKVVSEHTGDVREHLSAAERNMGRLSGEVEAVASKTEGLAVKTEGLAAAQKEVLEVLEKMAKDHKELMAVMKSLRDRVDQLEKKLETAQGRSAPAPPTGHPTPNGYVVQGGAAPYPAVVANSVAGVDGLSYDPTRWGGHAMSFGDVQRMVQIPHADRRQELQRMEPSNGTQERGRSFLATPQVRGEEFGDRSTAAFPGPGYYVPGRYHYGHGNPS